MIERSARRALTLVLYGTALVGSTGCGPSLQEQRRERELQELRTDLAELQQYTQDLKLRLQLADARNKVLTDLVQGLTTDPAHYLPKRQQLAAADASLRALEADVDALVATLRHSQGDVAALQAQRQQLQDELAQAKNTISEARATQAATDARVDTLRAVITPLIEPIRAGRVNMSVQYGQLILLLPEATLFEPTAPHNPQLTAAGKALLEAVAQGLKNAPEHKARVLGPAEGMRTGPGGAKHASELRVLALIDYLCAQGVPRTSLIAASQAVAQPLGSRFFEITLLPAEGDRAVPPTTEQLLETLPASAAATP